MAKFKPGYGDPVLENPYSNITKTSVSAGICMMNTTWRDQQHPSFINFISSFLATNSFRLNFVPISPDFIFNCGRLSVAFIFVTNWDCGNVETIFARAKKLKAQFAHLYVTVNLPTRDQNDSFLTSYFKYEMQLGKPTFVAVQDIEMGFEKIVKIAHSCGVSKQQEVKSKLKAEVGWQRKQSVQRMENFIRVVTSIPGIDNHDANTLNQAIGSIEGIAKASKEYILETTDLSDDKAETIATGRVYWEYERFRNTFPGGSDELFYSFCKGITSCFNLILASHEDEDVTWRNGDVNSHGLACFIAAST